MCCEQEHSSENPALGLSLPFFSPASDLIMRDHSDIKAMAFSSDDLAWQTCSRAPDPQKDPIDQEVQKPEAKAPDPPKSPVHQEAQEQPSQPSDPKKDLALQESPPKNPKKDEKP